MVIQLKGIISQQPIFLCDGCRMKIKEVNALKQNK